jgi:predicted extracellular nuclease
MPRALLWVRALRARKLPSSCCACLTALSCAPLGCGPLVEPVATACAEPALDIAELQGNGAVSPLLDQQVEIEGSVSVAPAHSGSSTGFFLQTAAPGARSSGIFVALDAGDMPAPGERLRVRGRVAELGGVTALTSVERIEPCGRATLSPIDVELGAEADLERWEGMWIRARGDWTLVDSSELERRGELGISPAGRRYAPGHPLAQAPSESASWTLLGMAEAARAWLRAGSLSEHLRLGARARELTAVVLAGTPPTLLATEPVELRAAPPVPPPAVSSSELRVAALNLDNYFVQLGARGARSESELSRQRTKLVAALRQLDADILALSELENQGPGADASTAPPRSLVDLLTALDNELPNELAYSVSESGMDGSDVIRSAIAYRSSRVRASGPAWFARAPEFQRAPLFQSFEVRGRTLSVGVVHLKSKLCSGAGQIIGAEGCGADTRLAQARALAAAVAALPEPRDVLLIGDFNSDALETPVLELKRAGFSDLFAGVPAEDRYSYVFEGRASQLDHALASDALAAALARAQIWHINADEPELLGYGLEHPPEAYQADARRSSDHDPILVDFAL